MRLLPLAAVLRRFWDTGEKPETAFNCGNDNPEGRAGKRLAIGAMANLDRFRIDFRFKG